MRILVNIYSVYPDVLPVDRVQSFMAAPFRDAEEDMCIVVEVSIIERHNGIGVGERYNSPLRRVLNAASLDN